MNIIINPADPKCLDGNIVVNTMTMQPHIPTTNGCSSSEGSRSAGDGGSESNYATVSDKNGELVCGRKHQLLCEDEEEEESHYSLIRKPDGQADETNYATMK